jgi:hypothetical protein
MWRKGNHSSLYSSLWTIWRSKRKTNSIFIVWLNAPQSGGAPYSRSRWSSFTNGNGTDSTSSRLYTGNQTLRFIIYLLFSIVIILFILFYFISVSTYQKYKWVEITECNLYMRVDDTKITRGTIQCLWHEEYRTQMRKLPFTFWINLQKWPKLNTLETKMAIISHTKIKQPSFGEKRPKLTYTKISRFMVLDRINFLTLQFTNWIRGSY